MKRRVRIVVVANVIILQNTHYYYFYYCHPYPALHNPNPYPKVCITPAAKKRLCEALIHFVLDAPTDGHHGHRVVNAEAEAQKAKKGLQWKLCTGARCATRTHRDRSFVYILT